MFQPQYYDMPRKQGDRIESPWTLGMKCWADAYLSQTWNAIAAAFENRTAGAAKAFEATMSAGLPNAHLLCSEVMTNCFVNASYNPARNGTCPLAVDEFKAGFDWQNLLHGQNVPFDF